jgi:hypothetical protein
MEALIRNTAVSKGNVLVMALNYTNHIAGPLGPIARARMPLLTRSAMRMSHGKIASKFNISKTQRGENCEGHALEDCPIRAREGQCRS